MHVMRKADDQEADEQEANHIKDGQTILSHRHCKRAQQIYPLHIPLLVISNSTTVIAYKYISVRWQPPVQRKLPD